MTRRLAALLLVAVALVVAAPAASAQGRPRLPGRRRLAQLGFPKPDICDELSENDFASAFATLDGACPQAEPWSCEGACWDGMHTLNYKCAHAAAVASAQAAGLDAEAAADRITSLFRTCPDAVLEHDDAATMPPVLSPPPPPPDSPSPSPVVVDPSLSPSPSPALDTTASPTPVVVDPLASPSPIPDPNAIPSVQYSPSPALPAAVQTAVPQQVTPVVPVVPVASPPPPPPPRLAPPPPRLAPPPPTAVPGGPNCPYNCCKYDWPPCSFYT